MTDEYIADVVRKGAKAIQQWREKHPNAPVMLVGLDLSRLNLVGADLSKANLTGCNMHLVHLIGANLSDAKLSGAKLRGANLVGANLASADLQNTILTGAILQNANLQGADLRGANLRRADLRGSRLRGAILHGADLQGAIITDAEYAQIQGDGAVGQKETEKDSETAASFTVRLGRKITAIELARLLKAFDDIHVFLNFGPVRIERLVINLSPVEPEQQTPDQPSNWLVVQLDRKASAWIEETIGSGLHQLRSHQARILRYKKLGMSEEDVWHNVRPLLEENNDPLGVLRDLFQKEVVLSFGAQPAPAPEEPEEPAVESAPPPQQEAVVPDGPLQSYIQQLESQDWGARAAAAESLGNLGQIAQPAMPFLMKAVEDENIFVREAAEEAIRKITGGA